MGHKTETLTPPAVLWLPEGRGMGSSKREGDPNLW